METKFYKSDFITLYNKLKKLEEEIDKMTRDKSVTLGGITRAKRKLDKIRNEVQFGNTLYSSEE